MKPTALFCGGSLNEDIEPAYHNWTSDERVTKFLRWQAHSSIDVTKAVLEDWISGYSKPDFYLWAIELKKTGEPIGSIGVVDADERTSKLHIGYCIGYDWWGCGYTSEAFAALIPFLFEEVKALRIESQHDPDNPGSGRVMEKCGLTYEGTLRRADWSIRGIVDAKMYALLAEEYFRNK